MKYLTKENITFCIALIGFILSVWNFCRDFLSNRKSLTVSLPCTIILDGVLFLKLILINNSRQPITVTRIQLHYPDKSYDLGISSIPMFYYEHPELHRGKACEPMICLPIHLEPLGFSAPSRIWRND